MQIVVNLGKKTILWSIIGIIDVAKKYEAVYIS
jgi:hypothetical protein